MLLTTESLRPGKGPSPTNSSRLPQWVVIFWIISSSPTEPSVSNDSGTARRTLNRGTAGRRSLAPDSGGERRARTEDHHSFRKNRGELARPGEYSGQCSRANCPGRRVGLERGIGILHEEGRTELELTYGKLPTQAQEIAKRDGKFEVRKPAGVAPCATGTIPGAAASSRKRPSTYW